MFKEYDWCDFYRDATEAIPSDMPKPRGNPMTTHCFVDASHGSDRATRRSQTGILLFCNKAPIVWHSKRQNTVEASTFGSEFQAMKNAIELIEAMRYKLRMFGVPLEQPTNIFCDNEAVTKQKHNIARVNTEKEASLDRVSSVPRSGGGWNCTSREGRNANEPQRFVHQAPATTQARGVA